MEIAHEIATHNFEINPSCGRSRHNPSIVD